MPEVIHEQFICIVCSKAESKFLCGRCHSVTYCGRECQKKDLKRHKRICSPMIFKELDSRGRGFIAAKDIKVGDLICKDTAKISFLHDYLRKATTFKEVDQYIRKEFNEFSEDEKKRYLSLKGDEGNLRNMVSKSEDITYVAIFMNNFLRCGKETRDSYFPIITNLTHCCIPNAATFPIQEDGEAMELRAIRDIKAGEKVTIDYAGFYPSPRNQTTAQHFFFDFREEKHEKIKIWGLECNCPDDDDYDSFIQELNGLIAKRDMGSDFYSKTLAKLQYKIINILLKNREFGWHPTHISLECSRLSQCAYFSRQFTLLEKSYEIWEVEAKRSKIVQVQEDCDFNKLLFEDMRQKFKSKTVEKAELDYFMSMYGMPATIQKIVTRN